PGGRTIGDEIYRRRFAGLLRDEWRAVIAVAELGADHLVRLALLDVGDAGKLGAGRGTFGRVIADIRPPHRTPLAPAERGKARGRNVVLADLATLDLVSRQELRSAPAGERRGELPRQIDGIADAAVHAKPA